MSMLGKVAIVGAGPIGCATAAHLAARGLTSAMWSPTGSRLEIAANGDKAHFSVVGALNGNVSVRWLTDLRSLADYDVVIVCIPGHFYREILPQVLPHLSNRQTVLVSGALSLVTLWLAEEAAKKEQQPLVGGWSTTATTAQFLSSGSLHLNELRSTIGVCGADEQRTSTLLATSEQLLGRRFVPEPNALAGALANINPIAHAAEVIPNLSRISKNESWSLFGFFGEEVARIAQRLDDERLAIASHFGFSLRSLKEHYHLSYHVPLGPLHSIAAAIEASGKSPLGPRTLEHRYIVEDMPFGLAFQEKLAALSGVPCPMHTSALTLLETVYGSDLREQNFLLTSLLSDADSSSSLLRHLRAAS